MTRRAYAIIVGCVCHLLFGAAIGCMVYMLYFGMTRAIMPVGGDAGSYVNMLLLLQFPVLHSWLLSRSGNAALAKLHPCGLGKDLATTTYAILASLQLLATFVFWTPSPTIWFTPSGWALYLGTIAFACSWLLLHISISHASAALHSGFLGWWAVARGQHPIYPRFSQRGMYRLCRQPIYLSFLLVILSGPWWGPDHLTIALVWGSYCVIGPLFKEQRFLTRYNDEFKQYQSQVSYFIPCYPIRQRKPPGLPTGLSDCSQALSASPKQISPHRSHQ